MSSVSISAAVPATASLSALRASRAALLWATACSSRWYQPIAQPTVAASATTSKAAIQTRGRPRAGGPASVLSVGVVPASSAATLSAAPTVSAPSPEEDGSE